MVLQKAWRTKVMIDGQQVYFGNDHMADIVEKCKAYGPIKTALKEKGSGSHFQTPHMKIHIH